MAIVGLKVPAHTGDELGSTVLADLKEDMQAIETSNNDIEVRQGIVDASAVSGAATAGTTTTLTDTGMALEPNLFAGGTIVVKRSGANVRADTIVSHTATVITLAAGVAMLAGDSYVLKPSPDANEPANANIQEHIVSQHAPSDSTANSPDAALIDRANHTGTQLLATISDAGTAASKDVPTTGDAAATEVVLGSDSRLSAGMPVATVVPSAAALFDSGFLKCNGAAISRTTYAALFTSIGTVFGIGDGTTTFALPDLRGEFIRGADDGRGIDSGRVFGSSQLDAMQGHGHNIRNYVSGLGGGGSPIPYNWASGTTNANIVREPVSNGGNGTPRTAPETRPRNIAMHYWIKF